MRPASRRPSRSLLGLVCNEATMTAGGSGRWQRCSTGAVGAPRRGVRTDARRRTSGSGCCRSTTSASWRRSSSRDAGRRHALVTKGAPEAVLRRCVDVARGRRRDRSTACSREGARVVAVATRDVAGPAHRPPTDERDLRLAGFLTFTDPPKADAGDVDRQARRARHRGQDHHRRQRHGRRQGVRRHRDRRSDAC